MSLFDYLNFSTNNYPNENYRKFLAGADSIHDFDDRGGRVDESSWSNLSAALKLNLETIDPTVGDIGIVNPFTIWLRRASRDGVTSSSMVEDQTIQYFENSFKYQLNVPLTKTITYRAILNKINSIDSSITDINIRIQMAGKDLFGDYTVCGILDIDLEDGEDWDMSYSPQDKILIAVFLLNFYFPDNSPEFNTKYPSYITFDAGSNIPSKLFGPLDQVINLVTPLNIADSALGETHLVVDKSQKRAGVKNKYVFPINETNGYRYTSNIYTESKYILFIPSPINYTEQNKYDFEISLFDSQTNKINQLRFNSDYKSGPSVNYLSNLIAKPDTVHPGGKMVNLTTFEKDKSLLLDLKRSGDWEQCNAAYVINKIMPTTPQKNRVILCTIDKLCSLYSRSIGQNTLWHYGTHLKLYRFPGELSPEDIRAIEEAKKNAITIANENNKIITGEIKSAIVRLAPLLDTISREGIPKTFKESKSLDKFLIQIARNQVLQTKNELVKILNMDTANLAEYTSFFSQLSLISGQSVNSYNYQPFIDDLNKFKSMDKSRFFFYDYSVLNEMRDFFDGIVTFQTAIGRSRKTDLKNLKEELELKGFFEACKKFNEILSMEENVFNNKSYTVLKELIDTPYIVIEKNFRESNMTYYKNLNEIFKPFIDNLPSIPLQRSVPVESSIPMEISGGGSFQENSNFIDNLNNTMTQEFEIMITSFAEITKKILMNSNVKVPINLDTFKNRLSQTFIGQQDSYTIQIIINDFLENCSKGIKELDKIMIEPYILDLHKEKAEKIKQNYLDIYLFFSCLYSIKALSKNDAIIDEPRYNTIGPIKRSNTRNQRIFVPYKIPYKIPYKKKSVDIIEKLISDDNIYNQQETQIYYKFVKELFDSFSADYLPKYEINDTTDDNTQMYMLKFCLKLKTRIHSDNIVLIIFTFFQNYFKYVIKLKGNTKPSTVSLNDLGYYPGLIADFNTQDASALFRKINFINDRLNRSSIRSSNWEFEQNSIIFSNFSTITFHLLTYILNPIKANTLLNAIKKISGGKKNKNTKKKHQKNKRKTTRKLSKA